MIQVTQEQVQKLGNENKSLQDKIISITNQVIEIEHFKTKALEIYANIEEEQQKIFRNLEIIQNYFQESNRSMEKVVQKEREAKVARNSFQKVITSLQKEETGKTQKLSISEQLKGDIMIKVWETKLAEYKRITKGINEDCQRIFNLIEKDSVNIGIDGLSELLGEVNITRHQLKSKEELEEKKAEISNTKMVNMAEIDKWMIASSSKLEKIKFTEKTMASQLPDLQRSFFSFEENEVPKAPKVLVNFLGKYVQYVEADK
jgi:hypothetical protein